MISKNQYNCISFFLSRVLLLGGGFSLLFSNSSNTIICSILGFLLGYLLLYIFYKKGINNNIKYIIAIIILFINILGNTVLTSDYLLTETPIIIIIFLFLLTCNYESKNINIIGRASNILFYISIFIMILATIGLVNKVNITFDFNNTKIIKGILIFGIYTFLPNLLIINYSKNYRFYDISKGYIIGCLANINVIIFIKFILGSKLASIIRFPEYIILKHVSLFNFINNIDSLLIMEWIVTILISGMICINIIKSNKFILLLLTLVIYILLNSNYYYVALFKDYILYLLIFIILISLIFKKNDT